MQDHLDVDDSDNLQDYTTRSNDRGSRFVRAEWEQEAERDSAMLPDEEDAYGVRDF